MSEFDVAFLETANSEKLSTGERLKQARKKRAQQLKKYGQYEKHLEKECGKKAKKNAAARKSTGRVHFAQNVVLLEAASRSDIEEVRSLLLSGVDPNVGNDDGLTALHQCCIDNSEDMLRLLVEFGASVNACDSELWTPLHAAATCGHVQILRYLVEQGADLLSVNGDGNMPYDICEHESALDFIESEMAKRGVTQELIDKTRLMPERSMLDDLKFRVENGSGLEFRGRSGETPLHIAATNGYVQVTQFLLDQRVSVNVTDHDLWQPIHCAAFWCQMPVVELLIQHGANLDVRTRSGESPIDVCEDVEMRQRIQELKKEIESSNRSFKSRALSRRRSSSVRRASVRRSSMKEKKALSQKASREEGRWLQDAAMQNNDDEEDTNISNNQAPETSRNGLPNPADVSTHEPPKLDSKHHPEPSSNTSHSNRSSEVSRLSDVNPSDEFLSPSHNPSRSGTPSGVRKGSRLPARENSPDFDQRNIELFEDLGKSSETTTPLIRDANKIEKCNGSRNHSSSTDVETGFQFNPGVVRGQKGCCRDCCVLQ